MEDDILIERRGRVLLVTLNRPEQSNALNTTICEGLLSAVELLDADQTLTAGVLTGAGKGFCAGMDLKAFANGGSPHGLIKFVRGGCTKPLIVAVEGFAVAGGLEIALTCDFIVAAKGAKLGIPEVRVGLFAAAGGLTRLTRQVPMSLAMELALTGEPISAEYGFHHGLVSRLAEPGQALPVALELAESIARNAPLAVSASKQLIRGAYGLSEEEFWKFQKDFIPRVFTSDDAKEGPRAFAQKREPVSTGS